MISCISMQSIKESECPDELEPPANGTAVHVDLERRDENYPVRSQFP